MREKGACVWKDRDGEREQGKFQEFKASRQWQTTEEKKRGNDYGFPFKRKTHHTQQVYNSFFMLKDAAIFLYLGC